MDTSPTIPIQPDRAMLSGWLRRLRSVQRRRDLLVGTVSGAARLLAVGLLVVLAEGFWVLPVSLRSAALLATLLYTLGPLGTAIRRAARRSVRDAAMQAEAHLPELRRHLVLSVDASGDRLTPGTSAEMAAGAYRRAARVIGETDPDLIVDDGPRLDALRRLGGVLLAGLCVFLVLPIPVRQGAVRLASPFTDHRGLLVPALDLIPGDTSVESGEDLHVKAVLRSGRMTGLPLLRWRTDGTDYWRVYPLVTSRSDTLEGVIEQPRSAGMYQAVSGRGGSPRYRLEVLERPFVAGLSVAVTPPSYTGMPAYSLPDGIGDVEALAGSRITIRFFSPVSLAEARLDGPVGSPALRMVIKPVDGGHRAEGSFILGTDLSWWVTLIAANGLEMRDPVHYSIRVRPDLPPRVDLLEPADDGDLTDDLRLPIVVAAADDYGVRRLGWQWRVVDREEEGLRWMASEPGREAGGSESWDLNSLDIAPGDVLEVWGVAEDNDTIGGPKRARGPVRRLRLPSLLESIRETFEETEAARADLERAAESNRLIEDSLERLGRRLRTLQEVGQRALDWESRREAESALDAQEELLRALDASSRALASRIQALQGGRLIGEETLARLQEVRKRLEALLKPELRARMEELRRAVEGMSVPQTSRAAALNAADVERMEEGLNRLLEMLRGVEVELGVDAAVAATTDLARREGDIARELEAREPVDLPAVATEQGRVSIAFPGTIEQVRGLIESLSSLSGSASRALQQAVAAADSARLKARLAALAERLSQSSGRGIAPGDTAGVRQAERDLWRVADRVRGARDALEATRQIDRHRLLLRVALDAAQLAGRQEQVALQPERGEAARRQGRLRESWAAVAAEVDTLVNAQLLSTPELAEATRAADEAIGYVQVALEQAVPWAARARVAVGLIENTAAAALSALSDRTEGGSGSSAQQLRQQLQNAARRQQEIIQGSASADRDPRTAQQRAAVARLSARQRALAEELERMEAERRQTDILGDLAQLAEEMREVAEQLRSSGAPPELIARQERIRSRLLDAARALRTQHSEGGRESERARGYIPASPGPLGSQRADPIAEALRRALRSGLRPEYEPLIRAYFEALRRSIPPGGLR